MVESENCEEARSEKNVTCSLGEANQRQIQGDELFET